MAKMEFQGREVDVSPVDFRIEREDWNEYQLYDGAHLRLRIILSDVFRVDGEFDAEGNPIYITKSGNVVSVRVPDELKRK